MAKPQRSFNYQKRTKENVKERANMKGGNYDSYIKPKFKQWKPKEGKNLIRVLPPTWDDARHYGLDIFINFSIGADNNAYLSLSKHGKGADPIADARREAQKEGEKELAKKLQPSQRILYWIIDRMDEDAGPLLWAAPFTFDKALSNLCIDEDTKEVFFIDNPEKGSDVRFYREGTGLNTEYDASKMKVLKPSLLHEDEGIENEWLDFITENPLPEVLNFHDYDYIKQVFDGSTSKPDEDEDEPPKRTRRKPEPEADEDESPPKTRGPRRDQEPDEDEEPEEKPVRRRRAAAEPEDDEPEDKPARKRRAAPDPDEDDDGEEAKPVRRRRGAPEPEDEADDEGEDGPPSTRRTKSEEGNGSLRSRLAARRRTRSDDE